MPEEKPFRVAGVVLIRKDGAVLCNHRDSKPGRAWPDCWTYPGGKVDEGETHKEAALRELTEETGYHAQEIFPVAHDTYISYEGIPAEREVFWAPYDDKQKIECNEGLEMRFMQLEELADKKMLPGQLEIMRKAIEASQQMLK